MCNDNLDLVEGHSVESMLRGRTAAQFLPDDDDPEAWLIHQEQYCERQEALLYVLDRLGEHLYGPAFTAHVLLGQSWRELEARHRVKANTLSHAFQRFLERVMNDCRRRFARAKG